jgi:acetyl esterase/lipase
MRSTPRRAVLSAGLLATMAAPAFVAAQDVEPRGVVFALWEQGAPGAVGDAPEDRPAITAFLPEPALANGTAVLIFPGGGYRRLAVEKEAMQAVRWMNSLGVAAFVVHSRLGPRYHHPAMIQDAQRAIRMVRSRAGEWGIDPGRVGAVGFSAGGHLAATAGTLFDDGIPGSPDPVDASGSRPDFLVLGYPVVAMDGPYVHPGSREHLLGPDPGPELVELLSLHRQVGPRTPPTFLVASTDDAAVPVENTLLLFRALRDAGIPVEMHVFQNGEHGFGLAPDDPVLASWAGLCEAWMRRAGWLPEAPRP